MDQSSNIFMSSLFLPLVLCGFLSVLLFLFKKWKTSDFLLPEYKFHPLIGSILFARELNYSKLIPPTARLLERVNGVSKLFEKEGFFSMCIFSRRLVMVYAAEKAKILFNHPAVQEKSREYMVFGSSVKEGLLSINLEKAQFHRRVITPAFHLGILKDYLAVFNEQAALLLNNLKKQSHNEWIDVESYIRETISRVICQTALGVHLDKSEELKEFSDAVDEAFGIITHKLIRPWTHYDFIYKYFPKGKKFNELLKFGHRYIKKITLEGKEILQSKKGNSEVKTEDKETCKGIYNERKSFIKLLLESHLKNPSFTLTAMRDEVLTFIIAGSETLKSSITMVLYMLGLHDDVQQLALEEIDSIFQHDSQRFMTYEDIKEMTYLDCVIKESLRLYPAAPIIGKEIKEDIQIGKYTLPKGSGLIWNFYMLHRDPKYFPNPEVFDPTRFFPENSLDRHPYAYMPFSAGLRNCIGQKFAVIQMKVIVSNILRNFRIQSLDQRDVLNFSFLLTLKSTSPIRLKLIPRFT